MDLAKEEAASPPPTVTTSKEEGFKAAVLLPNRKVRTCFLAEMCRRL
jgi:hypothetical protein